jgi:hypothetical protein
MYKLSNISVGIKKVPETNFWRLIIAKDLRIDELDDAKKDAEKKSHVFQMLINENLAKQLDGCLKKIADVK